MHFIPNCHQSGQRWQGSHAWATAYASWTHDQSLIRPLRRFRVKPSLTRDLIWTAFVQQKLRLKAKPRSRPNSNLVQVWSTLVKRALRVIITVNIRRGRKVRINPRNRPAKSIHPWHPSAAIKGATKCRRLSSSSELKDYTSKEDCRWVTGRSLEDWSCKEWSEVIDEHSIDTDHGRLCQQVSGVVSLRTSGITTKA